MPRPSKRSLAAVKRHLLLTERNLKVKVLIDKEDALDVTAAASGTKGQSNDSLSSSDEEDYTRFYSNFTAARSEWVQGEAKFRAAYTGSSRTSMHRKRHREQDRANSMKNSPDLRHYFTVQRKEREEHAEAEADYMEECRKAELEAKECISQNAYTNVFGQKESLTPAQKAILEALHFILCWLRIGKSELQARREICQMFEWSQYKERKLKFWLNQWIENRDLPTSLRGKHPKIESALKDEDVQEDIKEYLRQHPRKVSSLFLKTYLEKTHFPSKFGPDQNRTISKETCRSWLNKLGFSYAAHSQSVYIDGHEREDVVEYRHKFLEEMRQLEPLLVKVDDKNPEGPIIHPELTENQRPHIIVTHDECIFRAHDGKKSFWTEDGHSIILPKGPGRGIMVSDFLTGIDGRLELADDIWDSLPSTMKLEDSETVLKVAEGKLCRRACQYIEYGKQAQGFWGGDDVVLQVKNIIIC